MRKLALLLSVLYLLAMARPIVPLVEYLVNQDYIAEFLCINKDRPQLNCDGKCYLAKKLNEQDEKKRKNIPKINLENHFHIAGKNHFTIQNFYPIVGKEYNFYHGPGITSTYVNDIFHPPQVG